ncbi:MAG TPA: hypothetical protein VJU16_06950 [Planctomycetota bacterium]|nr:hypothetical protein [Planctomycetota bacterium]
MKPAASAILLAFLVQEPVCDHGVRGASTAVDLNEVARIYEETKRAFRSFSFDRPVPHALPGFDSGLPFCRSRTVRRARIESLPPEMKPLYFAPAGSETPEGALLVVTRARSIADVSIPADPELARRFGVRCSPTFVRPVSATEVELTEGGRP